MASEDDVRLAEAAVRQARRDGTLRRRYGLGVVGWITLGYQVARLLIELYDLIRERRAREARMGPGADPKLVHHMMALDGHDVALLAALDRAGGEMRP